MARLNKWAEQAIKVIDDRGDGTSRIRLVSSDGSTWQTWNAPFAEPDDWCAEAEALCSELSDDFAGEVELMFVAESSSGTIRSQLPRRISGKQRKGAMGAFGSGQAAPLQAMYEAQARTVERTLQSANVQLEVLTRTVESQSKANAELLDYIRAQNEHAALKRIEETDQTQQVLGQLMEQAPLLLELLKSRAVPKKAPAVSGQLKDSIADAARDAVATAAGNGARHVVESVVKGKQ